MRNLKSVALVFLTFICFFFNSLPISANAESVLVDLHKFSLEGGASAPVKGTPVTVRYQGMEYPGIRLTLSHRKSYNAIRFPVAVSAWPYNTLQLKALFSVPERNFHALSVQVVDKSGTWDGTTLPKQSKLGDDGWYQFSWDALYAPDTMTGADLSAITTVQLKYPFPKIPEGQTVDVTIIDMKFVSGLRARTGNPELFERWQNYIKNYKPDYSDSSKYLEPPLTGRLKTPVALTQYGKTSAQIVVPAQASAPLTLAGKELAYWLKEITGADLPVVSEAIGQKGPRIFVGSSFAQAKFADDLSWLGDTDGFAVRTVGNDIYIFGNTDKGTLNGVFTFIENNTDLIWPRPRYEMRTVFSKNPSLQIRWGDARDKPATRLRGWATNLGRRNEHELWSVRNRDNYPKGGGAAKRDGELRAANGDYVEFGGGHNISYYLGKENPERFWPVIDGKIPEKFNIWKHQPNFTAPGVVDVVVKTALEHIEKNAPSQIDCLNINIEDNWGVSTDPKSLEPIPLPDGTLLQPTDSAFRSTQYFIFLNEVARKIRQVHPKLMIGTYAYFFTSTPPRIPLEDNIRVYFCPYVRKDQRTPLSAPINNHWWWRLEAWAKATPNVVMREYYGISNGYRPLAETVAFDVRSYVERGIQEFTAELNPDEMVIHQGVLRGGGDEWDFMAMDFWVINRLYWNPNQDVEQLRKYYLRRTYREAAPAMEKFFGTMRTRWFQIRRPSSFESEVNAIRMLAINPKKDDELRGYLEEAAKLAQHPISKLQIGALRLRYDSWVSAAKKEPQPLVLNSALYYGWGSSTVTAVDGKVVPAVRWNPRLDQRGRSTLVNSALKDLKPGDEISFVVRPTIANDKPIQLDVAVTDTARGTLTAPPEAFQKQADGSLAVKLKLASLPNTPKPLDVAKANRITLTLSGEGLRAQPTPTFYLTDLAITSAN